MPLNLNLASELYLAAEPGQRLLARDTFTDPDSTGIAAHLPDAGPLWVVSNGTWVITSNTLGRTDSDFNAAFVLLDLGRADVDLQEVLTTAAGVTQAGIVFRWVDSSNYWRAWIKSSLTAVVLEEVVSGTPTTRGSLSTSISASTAYTLRVVASGNTIQVYLNGALATTYTAAATGLTATQHGLGSIENMGMPSNASAHDDFTAFTV
jgi:hypothetical protein